MTVDTNHVIRLTGAQIKPAAEVMQRAFADYPLGSYFYPDPSRRPSSPPPLIFRPTIRYGLLYGEVYATSPGLEGVAVWVPSSKVPRTFWRNIRSGNFTRLFGINRDFRARQSAFQEHTVDMHRRYAPFPHLYLQMLGVDPAHQGEGFGSRLLRHMFARVDAVPLPCYLETHVENNVAIYEHHGFKVAEARKIPGSELITWAMLRDNR